jgi:YggT family protein
MEPIDSAAILREFWYYYLAYYFVYWFTALLLARFVLSLFVQPDSLNVIWRVLVLVTDPLLRLAAPVTPAALGGIARPLVTVVWLLLLLLAYWLLLYQSGLAPMLRPPGP